ncbi:MAG TPA: HDIG domain-containing protein [Thermoanaerobaculia bacterium]|nr:HDIG domain-containing protein [Thermoanaerobaculia bacterium]
MAQEPPPPSTASTKARSSRLELISTGTINLRKRVRAVDLWRRSLETPALWVVLFLTFGTWALMPGSLFFARRALPNTIADRDFVATRDLLLLDEEATRLKQAEKREAVLPVYDLDFEVANVREAQVHDLFNRGRRLLARETAGETEAAREAVIRQILDRPAVPDGLRLTQEEIGILVRRRFSPELEDRIRGVLVQALRRGVVSDKTMLLQNRLRGILLRNLTAGSEQVQLDLFGPLGYPDEVREMFEAEVRDWGSFTAGERRILVDFLLANLPVNLLPNRSETLARQDAAAAGAGQVFNQVRKGQIIVRKGDVIDEGDAKAIAQMRGERKLSLQLPPLAGTLFLLCLAAVVVWLGLQRERVADHGPRRLFGEGLLLLLLSLLGAKFCFLVAGALSGVFEGPPLNAARSWDYAIPFATLALLVVLLLGRNAALLLSVLFAILSSRLVVDGDALWVVFYGFGGSLAAIYALDRYQFRQRLVMARVGAVVGLINVVLALIFASLASPAERGWMQLGFDLLCAFAGGLLAAAAASFAVPILESMLGVTTDIKLLELSNTNLPLLRELAFKAPGTFQHSLMVANLSKEGSEAIGADPVLAYTCGLYHDVGKMLRPDYFIENQRPGQNRHDKLVPSMSVLILQNHVKDGLELARDHGLPRVVRDAVQQHHGNRLIKYFYNKALEQRDPASGEISEEKFRYPGPKPQNKVMGVLMLADAVEAASRTLTEPTPVKIRSLIRTIVDDCLNDGQLDQTDLTLSDIRNVSEAFLRVLANIFHQRVDYPGFDFNAGPKREKRPVADAARAS